MAEDEEGDLAAVLARAKLSKHADRCARYPCAACGRIMRFRPCGEVWAALRLVLCWCSRVQVLY